MFPTETQLEISSQLGVGINTYNNLFKTKEGSFPSGSHSVVDRIAKKIRIVPYSLYQKNLPILKMAENLLVDDGGCWVSYRFDSDRRLYESYWTFSREYRDNDSRKSYLVVSSKDAVNETFKGEVRLNPDLTLNISIDNQEGLRIEYRTVFPDFYDENLSLENFKYLALEAFFVHPKLNYTTLELLIKIPEADKYSPRLIKKTFIRMDWNKNKLPTNLRYLAFNYLTRHNSKSRRVLDNYLINTQNNERQILGYTHTVFISCPVGYINSEDEFQFLRKCVLDIKLKLMDNHGFAEDNISCELLTFDELTDVPYYDRFSFFSERNLIKSTHHIALLPANLGHANSGVYLEIYFRIMKKLPSIIYVENRSVMPNFLRSVLESHDKPVNVSLRESKISDVASQIEKSNEKLFQFIL